jgi:Ca2+-binding EF-hand superfamily protein
MDYIISSINMQRLRKWLLTRGKGHVLDFTEPEVAKLKDCFVELDADQGGSIGIDELEEPLIGLGIASSREDVAEMIKLIDDDGEINFGEFL